MTNKLKMSTESYITISESNTSNDSIVIDVKSDDASTSTSVSELKGILYRPTQNNEDTEVVIKMALAIFIIIIALPFITCDIHYAYNDNSCVKEYPNKININLICEIWCKNLETYNNIINNIPKELKDTIKIKISKKNTNIKCNIDEKYLDLDSLPFYINIDYNRSGYYMLLYPYKSKKHSSMSHYKKILRIANIDETIINKLTTPKLMDNYLIKNKLYTFFHNNRDKQNLSILDDTFYKVSF